MTHNTARNRGVLAMQMFELMKKWGIMYWRSPAYNLTRFLMTTLIALFYGTMYLHKGHLPSSGQPFALPSPSLSQSESLSHTT